MALQSFRVDIIQFERDDGELQLRQQCSYPANSLKAKYEVWRGLENKIKELAKSDYAVKQSLTKEGYEVYNEVLNKLQDGSAKSKLAANENAFIYARMAESWARIRNEYGDTAYTAKDFMTEHRIKNE